MFRRLGQHCLGQRASAPGLGKMQFFLAYPGDLVQGHEIQAGTPPLQAFVRVQAHRQHSRLGLLVFPPDHRRRGPEDVGEDPASGQGGPQQAMARGGLQPFVQASAQVAQLAASASADHRLLGPRAMGTLEGLMQGLQNPLGASLGFGFGPGGLQALEGGQAHAQKLFYLGRTVGKEQV